MQIERTFEGIRQFVSTSRSGRRYTGATPEEAERKHLLAMLHAFDRKMSGIAHEVCASRFGTASFGQLTLEQMRELKKLFAESRSTGAQLQEVAGASLEPKLTTAQRKRLIKLGLYVLAPYYGKDWFWNKCKEWVVRLKNAQRVNLDEMTNQEAWYVIRRMEKIEKRLLQHRVVDEN